MCLPPPRAAADSAAVTSFSYRNVSPVAGATYAYAFTLARPVVVTHLGLWDYGANGLGEGHHVSIWNTGGVVQLSATVPAGISTPGDWQWSATTPKALAAGDYVIGAYYWQTTDLLAYNCTSIVTSAPDVTWGWGRYYTSGDGFPSGAPPSQYWGYLGPNFRYSDPTPVPEPVLMQLPLLLALGGTGLLGRRRRGQRSKARGAKAVPESQNAPRRETDVRTTTPERRALVLLVAMLMLLGPIATADTMGLQSFSYGGASWPSHASTYGWSFRLSAPFSVTHLGFWDNGQNGLARSHQVTIWNATTHAELLAVTIPAGTVGSLEGGFRWASVTPTLLAADADYVIGAYYVAQDTDYLANTLSNVITGPGVSWVGARYDSDFQRYPAETPSRYAGYLGPNFRGGNPIPEPALLQLPVLAGFGGFGWWWRRRRR